jgi:heme/copper-type cytochrome/quinol oxidase subunit 3
LRALALAHPASSPDHAAAAPEHHGSFMPLWLTIGATLFLLGSMTHWLALPGFLVMVAAVAGWVREDVHELSHKPFQEGHSDYWLGTIVLILSEVILFGVLFSFYFWSRAHTDPFLPEQILSMDLGPIVFNTVVLLSSGATVHTAQVYLKKGQIKRFRVWLAATIMLGAVFIVGQVREYVNLTSEGLTPASNVYGTSFFSLTGVHGLHVLAGLVVLSTILALSFTGFVRKERASGVEGAFLYWHFVDAIWVLVFSVVYLRLV